MRDEEEVVKKLRDRLHRAWRRWLRAHPHLPKQVAYDEFQKRLHDPKWVLRELKDVAALLWVLEDDSFEFARKK